MVKKQVLRFVFLWLSVFVWMGVLFYVSSIPGKDVPALFPSQDILFHLGSYAMLGLLFRRALKNTFLNITPLKLIFFTVLFCVTYGVSDEFHQFFIPKRSASGFDVFIDGIGSLFANLVFYRWPK